jgi:hypothetical protein
MTAVTPPPRIEPSRTVEGERRTPRHRPGWRFNAAVGAVLAVGACLTFEPGLSLSGFTLLLGAWGLLAVLGLLWLDRLVWCLRHHRLGRGAGAVLGWLAAPLLVLGMLAFDRAVGGVEHLAFRLSEDELAHDATVRLAAAHGGEAQPPVGPRTIGWLDIDAISVVVENDESLDSGPAPTDCSGRFVSYEVQQGLMSGSGYVYSPDGRPCAAQTSHLGGPWYWAVLWD